MKRIIATVMTIVMMVTGMIASGNNAIKAEANDTPTMATLVWFSRKDVMDKIGGDLAAISYVCGYEVYTHNGKIVAVCHADDVRGGWWEYNELYKFNVWQRNLI